MCHDNRSWPASQSAWVAFDWERAGLLGAGGGGGEKPDLCQKDKGRSAGFALGVAHNACSNLTGTQERHRVTAAHLDCRCGGRRQAFIMALEFLGMITQRSVPFVVNETYSQVSVHKMTV